MIRNGFFPGKELKELMKKMSGGGKESGAEDANEEEEGEMQGNPETAKSKPEHSSPGRSVTAILTVEDSLHS